MKRFALQAVLVLALFAAVASTAWAGRFFFRSCGMGQCAPAAAQVCGLDGCRIIYPASPPFAPVFSPPASSVPSAPLGATPPGGIDRTNGVGTKDKLDIGPTDEGKKGAVIGGKELPEDAAKPYCVIVGDVEYQTKARKMVDESGLRPLFHVVAFSPDQWQVKELDYGPGIWLLDGRNEKDEGRIFSHDKELDRFKPALDRLAECCRKVEGKIDTLKLPNLASMVDPWAIAWEGIKVCFLPALNFALLAVLGVVSLKL